MNVCENELQIYPPFIAGIIYYYPVMSGICLFLFCLPFVLLTDTIYWPIILTVLFIAGMLLSAPLCASSDQMILSYDYGLMLMNPYFSNWLLLILAGGSWCRFIVGKIWRAHHY